MADRSIPAAIFSQKNQLHAIEQMKFAANQKLNLVSLCSDVSFDCAGHRTFISNRDSVILQ